MSEGKMFHPGQLITWKLAGNWLDKSRDFYKGQYGYILHEDKDTKGVWHVMMMRKGSDTLHREQIYQDYLKPVEAR